MKVAAVVVNQVEAGTLNVFGEPCRKISILTKHHLEKKNSFKILLVKKQVIVTSYRSLPLASLEEKALVFKAMPIV